MKVIPFVIEEKHLTRGIEQTMDGMRDALTHCILAQAIMDIFPGSKVSCGYADVKVDGHMYRAKDTQPIVRAFDGRQYEALKAMLPFQTELLDIHEEVTRG